MYGSAYQLLPDIAISLAKRVEDTNDINPSMQRGEAGPEILDVGVGFGAFAIGFRQRMLDDPRWFSNLALARYEEEARNDIAILVDPRNWWAPIDGIEGDERHRNINGVHSYFYRRVDYSDVFDALAGIDDARYDIVIAADIAEHLPKDRVVIFLAELERICRHYVVVAVPCTAFTPSFVAGSPLETHRTHIEQSYLVARGYSLVHQNIDGFVAVRSIIVDRLPDQGVLR